MGPRQPPELRPEKSGHASGTIAREEVTDEVLMVRFQGGDRSAFATLVRRHKTAIYNFTLRMVRSSSAAEDLTQDTFLKVVQSAGDFKHEARFYTWVYSIARNLSIDHLRKMSLRQHPSLDQPSAQSPDGPTLLERTAGPGPSAERKAIGTEMAERITRCVEALPTEQREIFLLREVGNLSIKEMAAVVGVPEGTVKSRLRYALERLQESLAEYEDYARALR